MTIEKPGAVLITGCSSGIGLALAREFIQREALPVVATARRLESVKTLEGPNCTVVELDVTDPSTIETAVRTTLDQHQSIHMLINNAGWGLMGPIAELDLEDLRAQFETNVTGAVAVIQAVVPHMAKTKSGIIVNVGSVSGITASPFAGAYCASKAAMHAVSDSLRMELRPFGVKVVVLQPGAVLSDFGASASAHISTAADPDSLYASFAKAITNRAKVSQIGGMPADEFAKEVVDLLTRPSPPAVIRRAPLSRKLPLLGCLPRRIRDNILAKKFGLE